MCGGDIPYEEKPLPHHTIDTPISNLQLYKPKLEMTLHNTNYKLVLRDHRLHISNENPNSLLPPQNNTDRNCNYYAHKLGPSYIKI